MLYKCYSYVSQNYFHINHNHYYHYYQCIYSLVIVVVIQLYTISMIVNQNTDMRHDRLCMLLL
jgi:hypothetical protein